MTEGKRQNIYVKKYKEYYADVVDYSISVYQKFALHNMSMFFIYGLGLSIIDIEMQKLVCGLCFSMSAISFVTYFFMRFYFVKNKKNVMIYSNIYLCVFLLLLTLVYFYHPSSVGYTILICSMITTAMSCMMPLHYIPIITGCVVFDLILFFTQDNLGDIINIVGYVLNDFLVIIFAIGINYLYSNMKFREFKQKNFLQNESYHDPLTKIYNRRYVERYVEMNLDISESCAMILIDLDNFKTVNDELGHDKGDELLCQVSNILKSNFRKTDCVARIGGDEFFIMMPQIINKENVSEKVRKILKAFPIVVENEQKNKKVEVSLSVGVIFTKTGEENQYEELYRRADSYMYKAKKNGKGCAVTEGKGGKEQFISAEKSK